MNLTVFARLGAIALGLMSLQACHSSSSGNRTVPDAADTAGAKPDAMADSSTLSDGPSVADVRPASEVADTRGGAEEVANADQRAIADGRLDLPSAVGDVADATAASDAIVAGDARLADDRPFGAEAGLDIPSADASSDAADSRADKSDTAADGAIGDAPVGIDAPGADLGPAGVDAGPFRLSVAPSRMLDLVFMIDNSPSMSPKQAKLKEQFPKLINALKDPTDGTLPDLRIAIVDSDLGTAGAYTSGSCGPNDGNNQNPYGDVGAFKMVGAQACGVTDSNALWLEYKQGNAVNYTGSIDSVFTCLATNVGTLGCGLEHSLQGLEFAFARGIGHDDQLQMLRPSAFLGVVIMTDEDDCSAATNDGLFGDKPDLRGEAASLRCGTRAHACGGRNLTDEPPGYPTSAAFSAAFASCTARTDACPNGTDGDSSLSTDTSVPTACSPLKSFKHLATELKALKANPDQQVFVAGIFGWPLNDADMATAEYKIAKVPNPNKADTAHPTVWDYWPVCYDPHHPPVNPEATTGFDAEAAGWGATGGVRVSAFIDEFGANGLKLSICQPDFAAAMSKIGSALSKKMDNLCVPAQLGGAASCTATYLIPDATGSFTRDPVAMPACNATQSNRPCYSLTSDNACPGGYLVRVLTDGPASSPAPGTLLEFNCR